MADKTLRLPANVFGKYYVDETCVHCELCHDIAGEHFGNNEKREGFVIRQPVSVAEVELCQRARQCCPVEAIGDDGEP
jgi:ferredoxin